MKKKVKVFFICFLFIFLGGAVATYNIPIDFEETSVLITFGNSDVYINSDVNEFEFAESEFNKNFVANYFSYDKGDDLFVLKDGKVYLLFKYYDSRLFWGGQKYVKWTKDDLKKLDEELKKVGYSLNEDKECYGVSWLKSENYKKINFYDQHNKSLLLDFKNSMDLKHCM